LVEIWSLPREVWRAWADVCAMVSQNQYDLR